MNDYQINIQAAINAREAMDKISRVSEWWAKDFTGTARKLGDAFTVRFGESSVDFKIVEAVPDQRITWQVAHCHLPWLQNTTEWTGTSVVWEVSASNGPATVTMTHRGLAPGIECYDKCKRGWDFFVLLPLRILLFADSVARKPGHHYEQFATAGRISW
jgi:hypothetical protein